MRNQKRRLSIAVFGLAVALVAASQGPATAKKPEPVRFATYNTALTNLFDDAEAFTDRMNADPVPDSRAADVAEVIQRTRPDVLVLNEFDYNSADPSGPIDGFREKYLEVSQNGADPIVYPHALVAPSNTGIGSGFDLDNNSVIGTVPGTFDYANDSFGFGLYPGQFALAVLSMHPIGVDDVRTFQEFLWADMPGALLPVHPGPPPFDWYSPEELAAVRLSSKTHMDVPITVGKKTVHFLVSHPTPPVFDGPEDRNGTRNHDEIRFWADYVSPGQGGYIYDDVGGLGGLKPGEMFVIAGDQNSDPFDGDSIPGSAQLILDHPLVNTKVTPDSDGGVEAADQGGANDTHVGDPAFDTADFGDDDPGNLRVDYVLPRKNLRIVDAGIFWPESGEPFADIAAVSDHHLTWVDVSHGALG
jgi:hypothetical protein